MTKERTQREQQEFTNFFLKNQYTFVVLATVNEEGCASGALLDLW